MVKNREGDECHSVNVLAAVLDESGSTTKASSDTVVSLCLALARRLPYYPTGKKE
jgi:hypothetical protein